MGKLILARCGATDFDEQGRLAGALDIPVNVRGQAEMAQLAEQLRDMEVETIYASAGAAATQSARCLGERLGVKVKTLEELTNLDLGLWQGLPVDEIRRKHPKVFKQWEECPSAVQPPSGEMLSEAVERARKALKPVLKRCHHGVNVLVAPDPLRRLIRCQLKKSEADHLLGNGNNSNWEVIDVE